ncbi:MAG: tetratricopeptide repeat protein [Bryobacteraceae bacterium]
MTALNDACPLELAVVLSGMKTKIMWIVFTSGLLAQQADWIAAGDRALDEGNPRAAIVDYRQALLGYEKAGARAQDLVHLRVTLATAYMEAGEYHEMESMLSEAQAALRHANNDVSQAELLNAWSALHIRLGQLAAAETELQDALRLASKLRNSGDLLPTVLHNLAAVEMRTGRYAVALGHEQDAMNRLSKTLAPDAPTLIRGWASLASLEYMMGEPAAARSCMERALESAERTYGATHPFVAELLISDAVVLDKLKLKKEARLARARARKIDGRIARAEDDRVILSLWDAQKDVYLRSR